jgi:hypothetical protein
MLDDIATSLRRIADALERIEGLLQVMASPAGEDGEEEEAETEEPHEVTDWVPDSAEPFFGLDFGLPQPSNHSNEAAVQEAIKWFESLNCAVRDYTVVSPEKELWDWFAMFLGQRFGNLREFYEKWKASINNKKEFQIFLNDADSKKISDNVQFTHKLKEFTLISNFHYNQNMRKLTIIPLVTPEIINFVTGYWLEYYISRIIWKIITDNKINKNFALLRNIKITLPNNQDKELDLFIIRNSQKIWIECTTSEFQKSAENWREISDYLHLPTKHKIAIALKSSNDIAIKNSFEQITKMSLLKLEELPTTLNHLLS